MTTGLDVFDKAVQKTNLWLKDLMSLLGWEDRDRARAFTALQGVLLALRDRMTIEGALHLGAQLPMILRGFYFEEWDPAGRVTRERRKEEFLARVRVSMKEFPDADPERAALAVFTLLGHHVTEGELDDVRSHLPAPIRKLWPRERAESPQATLAGKPPHAARSSGDGGRRAHARKARKEIHSTIARARAEGVSERDLPAFVSKRSVRKSRREGRELPGWYERQRQEKSFPAGDVPPKGVAP